MDITLPGAPPTFPLRQNDVNHLAIDAYVRLRN